MVLLLKLLSGKSDFEKLKLVILSFFPVIVAPSNKTRTGILLYSLKIPFFA